MRVRCLSMQLAMGCAALAMGIWMGVADLHAANTPPPTKESKPSGSTTSTMSGSEQKGSNVDRNANTKTTPPPQPPKK